MAIPAFSEKLPKWHFLTDACNSKNFGNNFFFSFQDIRSLHSLTLSGNWLSVENIEVLVSKMPNLQELNIDETGIATLPPGLFYNNLKLKELNISANYLIHLDASGSDFLKKKFSRSFKFFTHERNLPTSICIHYFSFEKLGQFVDLKKQGAKYGMQKTAV